MSRVAWLSPEKFQTLVAKGETPDANIRKEFLPDEVKALDGESRTMQFTISTGTVDRDRDIITPDGWKLAAFKKNPVILWAHSYATPPIARAKRIKIEDGRLVSAAEFAPAEVYPFAETIYQLILGGFLKATSVGFRPLKFLYNSERGGVDFAEQELLEFSLVPVPANPEALMDAKHAGIDVEPLKQWAEGVIERLSEEPGLWMPRSKVQQALEILAQAPAAPIVVAVSETIAAAVEETKDEHECPLGEDCPMRGKDAGEDCTRDDCPMRGKGLTLELEEIEESVLLVEDFDEPDALAFDPAEFRGALAQVVAEEVGAALGKLRGRVD